VQSAKFLKKTQSAERRAQSERLFEVRGFRFQVPGYDKEKLSVIENSKYKLKSAKCKIALKDAKHTGYVPYAMRYAPCALRFTGR
jgi:hypothetical protein